MSIRRSRTHSLTRLLQPRLEEQLELSPPHRQQVLLGVVWSKSALGSAGALMSPPEPDLASAIFFRTEGRSQR